MDCVLTLCIVRVYSPLGMDNAMLISALGRMVSVGLEGADEEVWGVIELRKMGLSSIAFDRVLRRIGRYVSRVYCWDSNMLACVGAGYRAEGLTDGNARGLELSGR